MGWLEQIRGAVLVIPFAVAMGGCGSCDWLGGPTTTYRLEYEADIEEALRQRPDASEGNRAEFTRAMMSQTQEVVVRRLEELGFRRATVEVRGTRVVVDVPVRERGPADQLLDVKRSLSRQGRLEFRLVDDLERDLYERLEPMVRQDDTVELVREDLSFFLRATDRRMPDGEIITGARSMEALLERARSEGVVVPQNHELLFENITPRAPAGHGGAPREQVWRSYLVSRESPLGGSFVRDARSVTEEHGPEAGTPYIAVEFDERGRQIFGMMTAANVRKRLAIVVDREVTSAPVIMEPIYGGRARITLGSFMDSEALQVEARALVVALRSGGLPTPLTLMSETIVTPARGSN